MRLSDINPWINYLGPIAYWPDGSWCEMTEPMDRALKRGRPTSFKALPKPIPLTAEGITAKVEVLNVINRM